MIVDVEAVPSTNNARFARRCTGPRLKDGRAGLKDKLGKLRHFVMACTTERPGSNITGVSWFSAALAAKRLELLLQLVPDASIVALLLNPNNPVEAAPQLPDFEQAASYLGRQFHILNAGSETEIDAAFRALVERRVGALVVSSDPFFLNRRQQLVALAARHAIPTIYSTRGYVVDGGLMS